MEKEQVDMSVIFKGWQADGAGRSVDITASNTTETGGGDVGLVRKVQEWFVRGTDGTKETEFAITLPVSGVQTTYRGTHYNLGPFDAVYIVDDSTSEHNGDLVDSAGMNVDWRFTPVVI